MLSIILFLLIILDCGNVVGMMSFMKCGFVVELEWDLLGFYFEGCFEMIVDFMFWDVYKI